MKFGNDFVKFKLSDRIENFDLLREEPFLIFEKNNFFEQSVYDKNARSINDFEYFDHTFLDRGRKRKRAINPLTVSELKSICHLINSKEFYSWVQDTLFPFNCNGKGLNIFVPDPLALTFK